jgi:hypothetical protein
MLMDSMVEYYKDLLEGGEELSDPFEEATTRALLSKEVSEEEKNALLLEWNNRIRMLYGGEEAMRERMLRRRARRVLKHRLR